MGMENLLGDSEMLSAEKEQQLRPKAILVLKKFVVGLQRNCSESTNVVVLQRKFEYAFDKNVFFLLRKPILILRSFSSFIYCTVLDWDQVKHLIFNYI